MAGTPILIETGRLDGARGRTDLRESLRVHLPTAPPEYLEGALANPALGTDELLLVLANRAATGEILTRIGRHRPWMRSREAKRALVSHPKTPFAVARGYLPHLFWRELAEVAANAALSPVLRRDAERTVRTRLPELTLGERVTLARVASRGLIEAMREDDEAAVLQAVSGNPRTTESDLARVLARPGLPPAFLRWLAEQSSWSRRGALRAALVRHPRTPVDAALRLARSLSELELAALARDERAPQVVRVAAGRRASVDTDSTHSLESPADRRHPAPRGLPASR